MIGIYKITNKINGKSYIGQSINVEKRWIEHQRSAFKSRSKKTYPLYEDIRQYGIDNFTFELLEECEARALNKLEQFYVEKYNTFNDGYNQTEGGGGKYFFAELTMDMVESVKKELKESSKSRSAIGAEYQISEAVVQDIDNGSIFNDEHENYPLRASAILKKKTLSNSKYFCEKCGAPVAKKETKLCTKCAYEKQQKVERPEPIILAKLIIDFGFKQTGKHFGVSDNAIKKWCKYYGIPYRLKELKDWYNLQTGMNVSTPTYGNREYKPVQQINPVTNEVVATFTSTRAAGRAFGKKNGAHISEACKGILEIVYGYKWKFVDDESLIVEYVTPLGSKPVLQMDIHTNNIIARYSSIKEASRSLDVERADVSITRVCKHRQQTAYGYKWCYADEYTPSAQSSSLPTAI